MIAKIRYFSDRAWRTFGTGVCFAFFFLGGLLESVTIFPILYAWPGSRRRKAERVRYVVHKTFQFFVWMMGAFGLIKVHLHNVSLLREARACILVANHPTLIDVVILFSLVPRANCVVKGELWRNPYLKGVVSAAGFISNADGEVMLRQCQESLQQGDVIVIFPEGSRSVPGEPLHFKRGPANIAVRTDAPLLTVFVTCNPITLVKGERWYEIPPSRAHIHIYAHEWLQPQQLVQDYADKPAAARQLTRNLQDYFEKGLETYG